MVAINCAIEATSLGNRTPWFRKVFMADLQAGDKLLPQDRFLQSHLAPEDVIIAIEVSLVDDLNTDTIETIIDNIESKVKEVIPYATSSKIYVEPERAK